MQFSNALPRLLLHAQFVANESWRCLQDCLEKLEMSPEELEIQSDFMSRFYNKPSEDAPRTVYYDNEICEVLLCRQVLLEYIDGLFSMSTCPPSGQWQRLREYLAEQVCGRISANDQQPAILEKKLEELFHRTGSCIRDWIDEDGQPTDRYIEAQGSFYRRQLNLKKDEMFKVWIKRKCELDNIHSSSMATLGIILRMPVIP